MKFPVIYKSRGGLFVVKLWPTLIIIAAAIILVYQKMGPPLLATHKLTSVSPDKNYRVDVYSEPMFFAMPGGGGAGSHFANVILRNKWGWQIGSNYGCDLFMDDVTIEWNHEKYVEIAPARTIDFVTGHCEQ